MESITRNWYITAGVLISATGTIAGILADQSELIWVAIAIAGNSFFLHVLLSKRPMDPAHPKAARQKYAFAARIMAAVGALLLTAGCTYAFGCAMDWWSPFWSKGGKAKVILIASFENEKAQDLPIGGPLADGIRLGTKAYPGIEVRRIEREILDPESAQEEGRKQKGAVFMIWGRVNTLQGDSVNLTTNFEVLKEFDNAYLSKLASEASQQGRILPVGEKIKMEVQQALVKEFKCTVLLATGIIAYIEDDWSSATAIFGEAITTCEAENAARNTHIAYYHLGNCLYKQGQFVQAKAKFEKAAALAPDDPDYQVAVQNATAALTASGNADGALAGGDPIDAGETGHLGEDAGEIEDHSHGEVVVPAREEKMPNHAELLQERPDLDPEVAKYLGKKVSDNRLQGGIAGDLSLIYLDGKYGYVNRQKVIVIPPKFGFSGQFSEGRAIMMEHDNYGFIDTEGNVVIPPIYSDAIDFSEGYAAVSKQTRWGYIDKTGKVAIPFEYDDASDFSEGLAKVKRQGRFGYIDRAGRLVIPFELSEGFPCTDGMVLTKVNNTHLFYRKDGVKAFECKYSTVNNFSEGLAAVGERYTFGYIDKTGKLAIPMNFKYAGSFSGGKAQVRDAKGTSWYIDKTGKCVQDCK